MSKRGWKHFWKVAKWLNPLGEGGKAIVDAQKKGDKKHDENLDKANNDQETSKS